MRLAFLLIITVVFGTVAAAPSYGDESPGPRVHLEMRTKVATPEEVAVYGTTYISNLHQGDTATLELENYNVDLLVTDERDGEFSVELTLRDEIGTVMDSVTVLIGLDSVESLQLESGDFNVYGSARVEADRTAAPWFPF